MEENEWWGRLGVTPPEDGAKEQEVAAPAEPAGVQGEQAQELTEPAQPAAGESKSPQGDAVPNNTERETAEGAEPEETTDGAEGERKPQTPEERREQARQRRAREQAEREEEIRKDAQQKANDAMKHVFARLGLKDSASGKPIETLEDFEKMQQQIKSQRVQQDLKNGRLTGEVLRETLLSTPEVQQVLQAAENAKNAAKTAENDARLAQYNANMQAELAQIRRMNPSIQSTDDIIRMETGPEYARLLRSGLRPSEAYKLANFDAIQSSARAAAEQAARNAAAGKAHLQPTPTQGKQPQSAPEDYKQNMRRYIKGISDEEINRYYARFHKNE